MIVEPVGLPGARGRAARLRRGTGTADSPGSPCSRQAHAALEVAVLAPLLIELHQQLEIARRSSARGTPASQPLDDRDARTAPRRPRRVGWQVKILRRLGVSDTPVTASGPMIVKSRRCGSAVMPKPVADRRVGQRVIDRREQIVDRPFEPLDERRGDRAAGRPSRESAASRGSCPFLSASLIFGVDLEQRDALAVDEDLDLLVLAGDRERRVAEQLARAACGAASTRKM